MNQTTASYRHPLCLGTATIRLTQTTTGWLVTRREASLCDDPDIYRSAVEADARRIARAWHTDLVERGYKLRSKN